MVDDKTLKKLDRINRRVLNAFLTYNARVYMEVKGNEVEYTVFFRKNGVKTRLDAKLPLAGIKFSHVMVHLMLDMIDRVPELPKQFPSKYPLYAIKQLGDVFFTVEEVNFDTRKEIALFKTKDAAQTFINQQHSRLLEQSTEDVVA